MHLTWLKLLFEFPHLWTKGIAQRFFLTIYLNGNMKS